MVFISYFGLFRNLQLQVYPFDSLVPLLQVTEIISNNACTLLYINYTSTTTSTPASNDESISLTN